MALEPITREEKYLAKAAGQSVEVPEPITRKEMFLDAVAKSGGGSSGGGVQSDWNAAEGEPGHVLNRTHYKEIVDVLPLSPGTLVESDLFAFESDLTFTPGETYYVRYNGVDYVCVAFEYDGVGAVGNQGNVTGEDTGEPFIITNDDGLFCIDLAGNTEITVGIWQTRFITIPVPYLPKMHHIIAVSRDEWAKTSNNYYISNYDITDLWNAYKNGWPVYIDIDYGENGFKRATVTGYSWTFTESEIERALKQVGTIPVMLAACWHNGATAEAISVFVNQSG